MFSDYNLNNDTIKNNRYLKNKFIKIIIITIGVFVDDEPVPECGQYSCEADQNYKSTLSCPSVKHRSLGRGNSRPHLRMGL